MEEKKEENKEILIEIESTNPFFGLMKEWAKVFNERPFSINKKAIHSSGMNNNNVVYAYMVLGAESINKLDVPDDKNHIFMLNLEYFNKAVEKFKGLIKIKYDGVYMTITTNKVTKIRMGEFYDNMMVPPKIPYLTNVKVQTIEAKELFDEVKGKETFTLKCTNESLEINTSSAAVDVTKKLDVVHPEYKEEYSTQSCKYSPDYLLKLINVPTQEFNIRFKNDHPLQIIGAEGEFKFLHVLAQRGE